MARVRTRFASLVMKPLSGGVCVLFFLAALCSSCVDASVRATFRDVADRSESESLIGADYASSRDIPDYVMRDGHLYLMVQAYWAQRPRADRVQPRIWTCAEVARLKRSPDARAMLPDASALDGGIHWSECSQLNAAHAIQGANR